MGVRLLVRLFRRFHVLRDVSRHPPHIGGYYWVVPTPPRPPAKAKGRLCGPSAAMTMCHLTTTSHCKWMRASDSGRSVADRLPVMRQQVPVVVTVLPPGPLVATLWMMMHVGFGGSSATVDSTTVERATIENEAVDDATEARKATDDTAMAKKATDDAMVVKRAVNDVAAVKKAVDNAVAMKKTEDSVGSGSSSVLTTPLPRPRGHCSAPGSLDTSRKSVAIISFIAPAICLIEVYWPVACHPPVGHLPLGSSFARRSSKHH
jgi:hypothetical protein